MNKLKGFLSAVIVIGLFCTVLVFSMNALAAEANPCADDIAKYCKDVKPGKGAIMDCLEQHENELTPACREHEAGMGGKRVEMREQIRERVKFRKACRDDVNKFCADVKPGKDVITQCLTEHEKELSAPCAEMFKTIKQIKE